MIVLCNNHEQYLTLLFVYVYCLLQIIMIWVVKNAPRTNMLLLWMNSIQFIIVSTHSSVIVDVILLSAINANCTSRTKNTKVVVKEREVHIVRSTMCIIKMTSQRWRNLLLTDIKHVHHVWQMKLKSIVITSCRIWSILLIKPFLKVRFSRTLRKIKGNIRRIAVIAILNSEINNLWWNAIVNGLCHERDFIAWQLGY